MEITAIEAVYGEADTGGYRGVERWKVSGPPGRLLTIRADAPNADRIVQAVRGVLEARQLGRRLWDPSATLDRGLARMTGEVDEDAEHGISRADG